MPMHHLRRLRVASAVLLFATLLCLPAAAQNVPPLEVHTVDPDDMIVADFGRTNENAEVQSILQIRTAQTMFESLSTPGRGTIRFIDPDRLPVETQTMEMGFYQWGAGIFTENLFEFWTAGLSVRSLRGEASYLAVRDYLDTKDIRLSHDGTTGRITTTGLDPGGISIEGNGPVSVEAVSGDVSLTAEAAVSVSGAAGVEVDSAGPISVDGTGTVSVLGDGTVEVASRNSELHLRGESRITIDGDGPVSLEGTGSVTIEATTGDIDVIAPAGVTIDAGLGAVRLEGDGVVVATPSGSLNVNAGSFINLTTATTANMQATNSVDVKSLTNDVTIDAATNLNLDGANVSVTSAGPVLVDGGPVNVTSDSTVAINGNGTVALQSTVGNVTLHSTSTDGEVRLSAGTGNKVRVDSTGSLHVMGEIYLKGEPLAAVTGPTYGAVTATPSQFGTVGGSGAAWTVDPTDSVTYGYTINGQIMTVWFVVAHSTVTGSPTVLTVNVPENRKSLVHVETFCNVSDDNSNYEMFPCLISDNESKIRIYRQNYVGPWPTTNNKTSVRGTISFPLMPPPAP